MLSLPSSSALPLGLLYLLLSLGLSGTDARATPNPAPVEPAGQTINIMRRGNTQRSVDDARAWLEQNRLATHRKYGVAPSGNQKRANGQNLYVSNRLFFGNMPDILSSHRLTNVQFDSTYVPLLSSPGRMLTIVPGILVVSPSVLRPPRSTLFWIQGPRKFIY